MGTTAAGGVKRQLLSMTIVRDEFKKRWSEVGQLALADATNAEECGC